MFRSQNFDEEINTIAGTIVTNALHIPSSLFCPFCAAEFMFEFTLKDHLKRKHSTELIESRENDLPESEQFDRNILCPYCNAIFYYNGLIPKHVAQHHGRNWLQHWQKNYGSLFASQQIQKNNKEPEIVYASCSPGLSDIFDKLVTKDFDALNEDCSSTILESPQQKLKSILKKTPNRYSTFNSPSSISIRRTKSELMKRSSSARRELRFDLPPLSRSNSPSIIRKHRKLFDLWKLFRIRKNNNISEDSSINESFSSNIKFKKKKRTKTDETLNNSLNLVTSTPINFLDESYDKIWEEKTKKNFKLNMKNIFKNQNKLKNLPLLFASERFQCNFCDEKYSSNIDLLKHLQINHKKFKYLLKPKFKCGQCGRTFYRNSFLMRHCYLKHNPQNNKRKNLKVSC